MFTGLLPPYGAILADPPMWTEQQRAAIAAIRRWFAEGKPQTFYLAGYAGTGKTTLAAKIGEEIGCGEVAYATFTGKAAAQLRKKGCANAKTIDSLIYMPHIHYECARLKQLPGQKQGLPDPCGKPRECALSKAKFRCQHLREHFIGRSLKPKEKLANFGLFVIDEVSMVGERMGRDLCSFGIPILVLGDVAQLPPIESGVGYFTNREPDFQLTELHRFALGSPIYRLATTVRERRTLLWGNYDTSWVVGDDRTVRDNLLKYDQIIVGTHRLRHSINNDVRCVKGYDRNQLPQMDEKLVCLKNRYKWQEDGSIKRLLNGTMWTVTNTSEPAGDGFIELEVEDDNPIAAQRDQVWIEAPLKGFTLLEGSGHELPKDPFAFGYAITCHKAQGSQWKSVLVFDESGVFHDDRHRWLYTAITRAVERVTIVCGNGHG